MTSIWTRDELTSLIAAWKAAYVAVFHTIEGRSLTRQNFSEIRAQLAYLNGELAALDGCCRPGHGFMKGGLMLSELEEVDALQLSLLEVCAGKAAQQKRAVMRALDIVNDRCGRDTTHYLSQGLGPAAGHMRRELMSGRFATWFDELPVVKAW